jgi:lipid II:glycine glycyltransferase (peptidoglycan interpeptide bridge formation enzyme)
LTTGEGTAEVVRLATDDPAWDAFVASSAQPTYLQTSAWAAIKAPNGWRSMRVVADGLAGPVGGQVLIARPKGLPWGMGYLPRGPVATAPLDPPTLRAFTGRLREAARRARLAYVRMEPEAADTTTIREALGNLGWVPADHVQPDRTRIIDIAQDEAAILGQMHRKCRQSVSKAERLGVRVVEAEGSRLDEFHAIHTDAMRRAGISPRTVGSYRVMWDALAPRGMAHLLFAEVEATGEAVATLFLVGCGPRVVDLYGGTTSEGGRLRANYLLKWEAIRRLRAAGYSQYDLWGLPREGIEQFKSGFGGTEVDYVGAWDLVTDPVGRRVLQAGERARATYRRLRYRDHRPDAPDAEAASGGE